MSSEIQRQVLDELDAAGARVGPATHLTTTELVDRVDADRDAVEQALATLRFDEQAVLKGRRLGPNQGDSRRWSPRRSTTPRPA